MEILAATGLAYYKKYVKEPEPEAPHIPGHLDWYEQQKTLTAGYRRNNIMRLTEAQLRKIIRRKILKEEAISGEFLAQVAIEAMDEGVKTLANFVLWIRLNYPDYVQGLSKRDISKEASFYWKAEKKDRKPYDKYDTPGWGRFD